MEPRVIDTLTKEISTFPSVEKIILYGSRARGDNDPFSDIDLAVVGVSNDREWIDVSQKADVENSGSLLKIDLVQFEKADKPLQKSIIREGKVLYEN